MTKTHEKYLELEKQTLESLSKLSYAEKLVVFDCCMIQTYFDKFAEVAKMTNKPLSSLLKKPNFKKQCLNSMRDDLEIVWDGKVNELGNR